MSGIKSVIFDDSELWVFLYTLLEIGRHQADATSTKTTSQRLDGPREVVFLRF